MPGGRRGDGALAGQSGRYLSIRIGSEVPVEGGGPPPAPERSPISITGRKGGGSPPVRLRTQSHAVKRGEPPPLHRGVLRRGDSSSRGQRVRQSAAQEMCWSSTRGGRAAPRSIAAFSGVATARCEASAFVSLLRRKCSGVLLEGGGPPPAPERSPVSITGRRGGGSPPVRLRAQAHAVNGGGPPPAPSRRGSASRIVVEVRPEPAFALL